MVQTNEFSGNSAAICPLACGEALVLLATHVQPVTAEERSWVVGAVSSPHSSHHLWHGFWNWKVDQGYRIENGMRWRSCNLAVSQHLYSPQTFGSIILWHKNKPQKKKKSQTKPAALLDGETNPIWKIYKFWFLYKRDYTVWHYWCWQQL